MALARCLRPLATVLRGAWSVLSTSAEGGACDGQQCRFAIAQPSNDRHGAAHAR